MPELLKRPFGDLPIGTVFTFLGVEFRKRALSLAEDPKQIGHVFQSDMLVETAESATAPYLDEQGVTITKEELSVNGRKYSWGNLGIVSFERKFGIARLMVSSKGSSQMVSVFSTRDNGLVGKMIQAIDRVSTAQGANREI